MEVDTFSGKTSVSVKLSSIVESDEKEVSYIENLNSRDLQVVVDDGASHVFT